MSIIREKHPVQKSFDNWIDLSDGIGHPDDENRFFIFVKSVHNYHATKWKDVDFLRKNSSAYANVSLQIYRELIAGPHIVKLL